MHLITHLYTSVLLILATLLPVIALLYVPFGIIPILWYVSQQRRSRWFILTPYIAMGLLILVPPVLLGIDSIHDLTASAPGGLCLLVNDYIVSTILMLINLATIVASIAIISYNPPPSPDNIAIRRLGIICCYIAYIINGPWWHIIIMCNPDIH